MALKSKLFIRRAEREDLDIVVSWMQDPDFARFLYGDPARSPKRIREQIVAMLGRSAGNTAPSAVYLIIDSPDDGPIGLVSLQNLSWRNRSCSVDFYVGSKKHRSGISTAIAYYRALEFCFDELNLHRITAYIYAFNTASWRIMELSGAVREMTLRDHVSRDGRFYDMYAYGMLRPEFETLRDKNSHRLEGKSLAEMVANQQQDSSQTESTP